MAWLGNQLTVLWPQFPFLQALASSVFIMTISYRIPGWGLPTWCCGQELVLGSSQPYIQNPPLLSGWAQMLWTSVGLSPSMQWQEWQCLWTEALSLVWKVLGSVLGDGMLLLIEGLLGLHGQCLFSTLPWKLIAGTFLTHTWKLCFACQSDCLAEEQC